MSEVADFNQRLELFFGETSDAVAYAYARLTGVDSASGLQLAGRLTGPECLYAETLPAHSPLVDRGPGASLLSAAVVPEPCTWTPDMPHLYRAEVELRRGDEVLAKVTRPFAFRTFGAAGNKLIFDSRRWVLRAVSHQNVPQVDLALWRDATAAMLIHNPSDELCQEASRTGVLIAAQLDAADADEVRRLSRWPAVGIVVLAERGDVPWLAELRHNLILAQRFAADEVVTPAPWAQIVVVEVGKVEPLQGRFDHCSLPRVAVRSGRQFPSVADARAACDHLQRDLAGQGDWAGYVV